MTDDYAKRLDEKKRINLGHTLLKAARLWDERALAEVKASHPSVRRSHLAVLPHLDLEGTRATVLAERAGVTKQAMGQVVEEMVAAGYLERRPDPEDGRARLVALTEKGRASMLDGLAALGRVEAEVRAELGDDEVDRLAAGLGRLLRLLEGP